MRTFRRLMPVFSKWTQIFGIIEEAAH